jgi:hypothetical protein
MKREIIYLSIVAMALTALNQPDSFKTEYKVMLVGPYPFPKLELLQSPFPFCLQIKQTSMLVRSKYNL